MKFLIILVLCASCHSQFPPPDFGKIMNDLTTNYEKMWKEFVTNFQKIYVNPFQETLAKFNVIASIDRIIKHNMNWAANVTSFTMGLYEFSDLPIEDAIKLLCSTKLPPLSAANPQVSQSVAAFPNGPASKDWRSVLLPVVDQGV